MAMATSETICKFNQTGYCKYESHCRKHHVTEICPNIQCTKTSCLYRHPRVCRYFSNSGKCKFSDSCAYLHKNNNKTLEKEISEQKKEFMKEIRKLRVEIEDLRKIVCDLSIQSSQGQTSAKTLLPTFCILQLLLTSRSIIKKSFHSLMVMTKRQYLKFFILRMPPNWNVKHAKPYSQTRMILRNMMHCSIVAMIVEFVTQRK